MAGFFDRMKQRFTEGAAGTTDLSNLSEDQQKLLRRQYIGRLGASLYQNGDFGAGMEAQAAAAKEEQAARLAATMQRQRADIMGRVRGVEPQQQQPPLNAAQQRLPGVSSPQAAPQAPQAAPQAPQAAPAMGGDNPSQPQPQQQQQQQQQQPSIPDNLRARLQEGILELQEAGDLDGAKQLLNYAKQFAPLETWFAPTEYFDPASKQTRIMQASNLGGQNLSDTRAAPTEKVQSLYSMVEDPNLFAMEAALRSQGAARTTVNMPAFEKAFDSKLGETQAAALTGWQEQAIAAQDTLSQLSELEGLLSRAQTGATPEVLAQIGRYVGAPAGATLEAVQSAAMPFVLSRMQQLGGGDSNEEMRSIKASLPGFGISPEANAVIIGAMRRASQRAIQNYQDADLYARTPGNVGLRGYVPTVRAPQAPQPQQGGQRPLTGSRYNEYGLEE